MGNDKTTLDTTVLMVLDTMPKFRGGDKEYMSYLNNNLKFPPAAIEKKISGKVYISFIVEPNGTLSNITILKGLSPDIDNEIFRAFSVMPRWIPGIQNGLLARVKIVMPINIGD
jgi:periplasmic protein TonB